MKQIQRLLAVLLAVIMLLPYNTTEIKAADSYEDASEFYDSADNSDYHCEFADMNFYYATRGKSASINKKRYGSIGWRITATSLDGQSMYIDLDKPDYVEQPGFTLNHIANELEDDGYYYSLYRIAYADIVRLMENKDETTWKKINEQEEITFSFTAIMSIKQKGETDTVSHVTSEDGKGGVTFDNTTHVYYVGTEEGLAGIQAEFSSSNFTPFYDIQEMVPNPLLTITYDLNGGTVTAHGTSHAYGQSGNILTKDGKVYKQEGKRYLNITTLSQTLGGSAIFEKRGYKLVAGQEWINSCEIALDGNKKPAAGGKYYCGNLHPGVAQEDVSITLTANWEPISYDIIYDANKGDGSKTTVKMKYDVAHQINAATIFSNAHHTFKGWNTDKNGNGTWYTPGESVKNLRDTDGSSITLYAIWEPDVYEIIVDPNGGSGGTNKFFEIFGVQFSADGTLSSNMTSNIYYEKTEGTILYAYWVDETLPESTLSAPDTWTNAKDGNLQKI